MDAEGMLNEVAEKEGWDDAKKIEVLVKYIENQKSDDAFKSFLDEEVDYDEGYGKD
jgi:hypothetical protein